MKKEYEIFITYVRTLQFLGLRHKGTTTILKPVHIPQREIEKRFFIYPLVNRKDAFKWLIQADELKIHEEVKGKRKYITYEALQQGQLDFSLIEKKEDNFNNPVIYRMREDLKNISLRQGAPSTLYFDTFLNIKDKYLNIFFTVDNFSRRIHTPVTNFHKKYRSNILFFNKPVASLDVATMQPLLLGKILLQNIGNNEYSDWINEGKDVYLMLKDKTALNSRDEAKKRFFEIIFAPPSNSLADMFGSSNWINWINQYKGLILPQNPHNKQKRYSNLAWLLQSTEVSIMYKVWAALYSNSIPFLSVHDEILIEERNEHRAEWLFNWILSKEFDYFKLNSKISH